MVVTAALLALVGVLTLLFVRRRPPSAEPADATRQGPVAASQMWRDTLAIVRNGQFWLVVVYYSATFGVLLSFNDLWDLQNNLNAYGRSLDVAGPMNAMIALGGAAGGIALGWLAGKIRRPAFVAKVDIAALAVLMLLVIYLPRVPDITIFVLLFACGFFFGGSILGFTLVASRVPAATKATAFGLMSTIAFLFAAALDAVIGSLVGGVEPSALSSTVVRQYQVALTPIAAFLVLGTICSLWIREDGERPQATTAETVHNEPREASL